MIFKMPDPVVVSVKIAANASASRRQSTLAGIVEEDEEMAFQIMLALPMIIHQIHQTSLLPIPNKKSTSNKNDRNCSNLRVLDSIPKRPRPVL